MANTHETTADLIAWLRRPREGENAYLTAWRDEIADRLEAAWKREKAAIEADALAVGGIVEAGRKRELSKNASKNEADFGQLGDAAKLREALVYAEQALDIAARNVRGETGMIIGSDYSHAAEKARAALSAPPRNCDLARDWMRDLYAHFQPPASVKREMPPEWVDSVMAFCRWLVAPATEQEGGNK